MPTQKTLNKMLPHASWVLLVLFIAGAYAPLMLKGGIIADDWGDIAQNLICNELLECYQSWFPLFSNRPLAPIPIVFTTFFFGLNISWYLIFNSCIYFIAIFTFANTLKEFLSPFAKYTFIALACIPTIAMPIVVSPINQSTATLAFLFWSISIHLLFVYCKRNSFVSYFMSYVFLLGSLLTYEIMLPFIVMTTLMPFILKPDEKFMAYLYKFVIPTLLVLSLVFSWQKVIAPNLFEAVHSRLSFDPNNIWLFFMSWLSVFTTQLPKLFAKTFTKINTYGYLVAIAIVALLASAWHQPVNNQLQTSNPQKLKQLFAFVCLLSFIASSLIFILSGSMSEIGGYQSRALSSTWLSFALLISSFINLKPRNISYFVFTTLLCCSTYFSFGIQRDNYIRSWALQSGILEDVLLKIDQNKKGVGEKAVIIGNVPGYLPNNFNNELVFTQPWDFGAALSILTNAQIVSGAPLDTRNGDFSKSLQINGGKLIIDRWWKADTKNLWFYDYDPTIKSGTLRRIPDIDSLKKLLVSLGYLGEFESKSYVTTHSPINFGNDWLDRSKYIISGWGERESWGGIWSTQDRATIRLPMPESGAKSITFNVNAFVTPNHPKQDVHVMINGRLQGKASLNQFEDNTFSIPLPQIENKSIPINIDFEFPNAISPKSLKIGDDDRKLGIGLKTATFQ